MLLAAVLIAVVTNAVLAIKVLLSPAVAVGADGVPIKAGEFSTNAVVASCVVFVPTGAVGAVGVPVKAGETKVAKVDFNAVIISAQVIFFKRKEEALSNIPISSAPTGVVFSAALWIKLSLEIVIAFSRLWAIVLTLSVSSADIPLFVMNWATAALILEVCCRALFTN
jgi:hypothetical protein